MAGSLPARLWRITETREMPSIAATSSGVMSRGTVWVGAGLAFGMFLQFLVDFKSMLALSTFVTVGIR
jgi:hypothetical protein